MTTLKLLLFDAGIVIGLHELGLWEKLIDVCEITMTRTVAEDEVVLWEDDSGEKTFIDIDKFQKDIKIGRVNCIDVPLPKIAAFKQKFSGDYFDRLDDGEAESLAFMLDSNDDWRISSSDSIVFKILGRLARRNQGISLEEILKQVGLDRQVKWKYSKAFRDKWTKEGEQDNITGIGMK